MKLFLVRAKAFIKLVRGEDKSVAAAGFYSNNASAKLGNTTFFPKRTVWAETRDAWRFVCRRHPREGKS